MRFRILAMMAGGYELSCELLAMSIELGSAISIVSWETDDLFSLHPVRCYELSAMSFELESLISLIFLRN